MTTPKIYPHSVRHPAPGAKSLSLTLSPDDARALARVSKGLKVSQNEAVRYLIREGAGVKP